MLVETHMYEKMTNEKQSKQKSTSKIKLSRIYKLELQLHVTEYLLDM